VPAQLVCLADIYCSRVSQRDYRAPLQPTAALRAIFLDAGREIPKPLAHRFIKAIGVFPAGTPVRLRNGELAIVAARGRSSTAPRVYSIVGSHGVPLLVPVRRDTSEPELGVHEAVRWSDVATPPQVSILWGKVADIGARAAVTRRLPAT
jgi:hypothetical protein